MQREEVVVELRPNRLPHHNHPDWVAFLSILRGLRTLVRTPATTLGESLYGFAELGNHFTAEQLLDEINSNTAKLRVMLENHRAAKSKL
jgi:hypothetical protein